MSDTKRRDFLKATAGIAAGSALGGGSALFAGEAAAQQYKVVPEKGAKLRVLRWKRFVPVSYTHLTLPTILRV